MKRLSFWERPTRDSHAKSLIGRSLKKWLTRVG
jgi:hypothetical protein